MNAKDQITSGTDAPTRREFLRTAGRWGGATGLVALLAWLERPGRGGVCLDAPLCRDCPALSRCSLPDGVDERARTRQDNDTTERSDP
ncbi:MAG: hypothetical protein H7A46_10215 [Verrucomicrobiales bacterium]|nr:hypothetical protein [Verrucomicrobiales bacterium]